KSLGGLTLVQGLPFINSGTLTVEAGYLNLLGGLTNSATISAAAAGLGISGTVLTTDSSVIQAASVDFSFCTGTIAGLYNVTGSTYLRGTIALTGTVASLGALTL